MKNFLVLISLPCLAMEIPKENVFSRESAGQIVVAFKNKSFFVNDKELQKSDVDETLRKVHSEDQLKALLRNNYLHAHKASNGDFTLTNEGRLEGSGPFLAWTAWGLIKGITFALPFIAKKQMKKKNKHHHRESKAWQAMDTAADAIKSLDGEHGRIVIEKGTSFIYDEAVQKGYIYCGNGSSTGDDAPMATMMLVGSQNVKNATTVAGCFADRVRDALMVVPGP